MKIALDAMGGDHAPSAIVNGAKDALASTPDDLELLLLGDEEQIINKFSGPLPSRISIHHCSEIVTSQDQASKILKTKPNSSIVKGIRMLKNEDVQGFISAGHTGCILAASLLILGRMPGVRRPALGAYISTNNGGKILCDVGANPDANISQTFA